MVSKKKQCIGCKLSSCNDKCYKYREAADKIWDLSKEYERQGLFELSDELKSISQEIHDKARQNLKKINK